MELEFVEGQLEGWWKVGKPMTFCKLHEKLSEQILRYNHSHRLYPGNDLMQMKIVHNHKKMSNRGRPSVDRSEKGPITKSDLNSDNHARQKLGRLCGYLEKFQEQNDSVATAKN